MNKKDLKKLCYDFHKCVSKKFHIASFNKFVELFEKNDIDMYEIERNDFNIWLHEYIFKLKNNSTVITEQEVYRGRILKNEDIGQEQYGINIENLSGFDYINSKETPISLSNDGRCNLPGASYFYAAEDEYTALVEIRPFIMQFLSLAVFKIHDLLLADLAYYVFNDDKSKYYASKLYDIFRFIKTDQENYKAPQYVSELFRKYGFDGIKYPSSLSAGNNIVIFNCSPNRVKFLNSRIVRLCQTEYDFADIKNNDKVKKLLKNGYTEQSCEKSKQDLQKIKEYYNQKI